MLKLPSLFCFLLVLRGSWANKKCKEMPGDPGRMVAHGIHSLTLNMLRHYFEPQATSDNGIPTVNLNRSETNILNENAVFINLTNSHPYPAFFALDHILSHMDDEEYGIKHANPLDELGHAMHMHSIWQRASELYKKVAAKKRGRKRFCRCLLKTYNASIMDHLELLAKQIRFPEQFANQINAAREQAYAKAVADKSRRILPRRPPRYGGGYCGCIRLTILLGIRQVSTSGGESLKPGNLFDLSIVDEASWEAWKVYMAEPGSEFMNDLLYNLVHYIHCKLNN